jgi:HAD superfamily hydrolase (TIGR01509 family)
VLIDSETVWGSVREQVTRESGGRWHDGAQQEMMGMSSQEWSRYMRDSLGVPMEPNEISALVVERLRERYERGVPLLPGAVETVRALVERWPLGLASSSNRPLIDLVLELTGLTSCFRVTVSSEEVGRGKPAPDVYLEAARRLDADPSTCAAVEDATNGIRSAKAAGMRVMVVPHRDFPPAPDALDMADIVVDSLADVPSALARWLERCGPGLALRCTTSAFRAKQEQSARMAVLTRRSRSQGSSARPGAGEAAPISFPARMGQ